MAKVVSWKEGDPTCFVIYSVDDFKREVIPKYFESSISSFKRQLNYYGFIKIQNENPAILLKDEKKKGGCLSWTYRHEHGWLCKGERDLLQNIRRTTTTSNNPTSNKTSSQAKSQFVNVSRMVSYKDGDNSSDLGLVSLLRSEVDMLRTKLNQMENKMSIYQKFMEDQLAKQQQVHLNTQPHFGELSTNLGDTFALPRSRSVTGGNLKWGDAVPLPRSRSTNGKSNILSGIERLNTNESTSSAQWAMLKDILMDESSCPNPFPHDHSLSCYTEKVSRANSITGLDTSAALDKLLEASVIVHDHSEEV